jgi:hypothetical protein
MNFHSRKLMLISAALTSLLAHGSVQAAAQASQPAAWVARDLNIDLHNLPGRYSCDDLWHKFHDVLLVLGARPDLKVLTVRCERGARSPSVRLQFSMPDLVKPTAARGTVIDAAAATVRLEPGHPASLNEADCELLRQMKDRLLAPLSLRVVSFNLACSAPASRGAHFNVSVQTLMPLDSRARVAEEHDPPLKPLN